MCVCVHARVQGDGVGEMFDDKYTCMLTLCVLMSASLFIYFVVVVVAVLLLTQAGNVCALGSFERGGWKTPPLPSSVVVAAVPS